MTEIEILSERNVRLSHAVQSGVRFAHESISAADGEPKHLRTGVNIALCNNAALARLLIERGLFTMAEYLHACNVELEAEVGRYEAMLSEAFGKKVTLG